MICIPSKKYQELKEFVDGLTSQVSQEFIPLSLVKKEIAKEFGMDDRTIKKYLNGLKRFDLLKSHPDKVGFKNPNPGSSLPEETEEEAPEAPEAPEVDEIDKRAEAAGA